MTLAGVAFDVVVLAPLCVSTGRPTGEADAGVARNPDGIPVVPASTLKGAARDALMSLLGPEAGIVGRNALREAFGTAHDQAGCVHFTDAVPLHPEAVDTAVLTSVALSERRTALPGRLLSIEVVQPLLRRGGGQLRLRGELRFVPGADGARTHSALAAAATGLAAVRHLGARTRRGWGRVRVALHPDAAVLSPHVAALGRAEIGA